MSENSKKLRALTGITSSGKVHLGNYFGAIKPALEFQKTHECFFFIADYHSLISVKDRKAVDESVFDITAIWLSLGLDTDTHYMYRQSDIPLVTELMWITGCSTNNGLLQRAHAFKDAVAAGREVNFGLFSYPVLMSCDILLYNADVVPVGKDQAQHLDIARDIAGSFNAVYGDILKPPATLVKEDVITLPGLDGRKMSKSYGNVIPLFCPEKELLKKVRSITTDSSTLEESKELDGSLVGDIYKLFGTQEQYDDLKARLKQGGLGWGHAKNELFEIINSTLSPFREKYFEIREDRAYLEETLKKGAHKASIIAGETLDAVRTAVGLSNYKL